MQKSQFQKRPLQKRQWQKAQLFAVRMVWALLFVGTAACTHANERTSSAHPMSRENVRLAQAQLAAAEGSPVQGVLNFEQMPNSVIITYRLEGLKPKSNYRIFVQEEKDCSTFDLATANPLKELRANKSGMSENTFKTVEFTVSGDTSLLGREIVIASLPDSPKIKQALPIACGRVEPQDPTVNSQ